MKSQVTIMEHAPTQHLLWVAALHSGHTGDQGTYVRWVAEPTATGGVALTGRLRLMRVGDYRHLVGGLADKGWSSRLGDDNDLRRVIVAHLDWLMRWDSGWRILLRACDSAPATPDGAPWTQALTALRAAVVAHRDADPAHSRDDYRRLLAGLADTLPVR